MSRARCVSAAVVPEPKASGACWRPDRRARPGPRLSVDAGSATEPLDADLLAELGAVVRTATKAFEEYDHARALEATEQFFWTFCDDYLELVKERAYGASTPEGQASAVFTLRAAVEVMLRLLAPFLPFATEEVWSWTHDDSVHRASWPTPPSDAEPSGLLEAVGEALIGIRRAKTDAKVSQKTEVTSAVLHAPATQLALVQRAAEDLKAVGKIATLAFAEGAEVAVSDVVFTEQVE